MHSKDTRASGGARRQEQGGVRGPDEAWEVVQMPPCPASTCPADVLLCRSPLSPELPRGCGAVSESLRQEEPFRAHCGDAGGLARSAPSLASSVWGVSGRGVTGAHSLWPQ